MDVSDIQEGTPPRIVQEANRGEPVSLQSA